MSWTKIEEVTLSGSQASVTLGTGGTLPQTYKTLKLVVSARDDRASAESDNCLIKPNNATANQSLRLLYGNGATAASVTGTTIQGLMTATTATASTFGNSETVFPNYSSNVNKAISSDGVSENNGTTAYQGLWAQLWSDTAAITSLVIVPQSGTNFVSGSSFTLYGLK